MDKQAIDNFIKELNNELDKIKKVIIANPINKNSIDELNLNKNVYEVVYTKLIEKDKIYITDKKGKDILFGNMKYMPYTYTVTSNTEIDTELSRGMTKPLIWGPDLYTAGE